MTTFQEKQELRKLHIFIVKMVVLYFVVFLSTGSYYYRTHEWTYRVHPLTSKEECYRTTHRLFDSYLSAAIWPLYWSGEFIELTAFSYTPYQAKCLAGEIGNDFDNL